MNKKMTGLSQIQRSRMNLIKEELRELSNEIGMNQIMHKPNAQARSRFYTLSQKYKRYWTIDYKSRGGEK